jgi:hypothetical protein
MKERLTYNTIAKTMLGLEAAAVTIWACFLRIAPPLIT